MGVILESLKYFRPNTIYVWDLYLPSISESHWLSIRSNFMLFILVNGNAKWTALILYFPCHNDHSEHYMLHLPINTHIHVVHSHIFIPGHFGFSILLKDMSTCWLEETEIQPQTLCLVDGPLHLSISLFPSIISFLCLVVKSVNQVCLRHRSLPKSVAGGVRCVDSGIWVKLSNRLLCSKAWVTQRFVTFTDRSLQFWKLLEATNILSFTAIVR